MSKENGDQLMLKRSFGMREAVTITVGTVIGVGLFTTGAQEEGARMDREYKLWKRIVAAACVIAVLLYVIPLIG
jgi:hypothetical protein